MPHMTHGIRIGTWRKVRRLNQAELARSVGVDPSAVSLWEGDICIPSPSNLEKIVTVLGITLSRFYGPLPKVRAAA